MPEVKYFPHIIREYFTSACASLTSSPANNHSSCRPSSSITSAVFFGQRNRSRSNLFCHKQNPLRSQYRTLIRLRPLLLNAKYPPPNGSCPICCCASIESPLIALRKSVAPTAR